MRNFNFQYSANLLKAGKTKNGKIPITIIPSLPTPDRVNDTITLKAFDENCRTGFLKDGIIDYDHLSYRSKDPLIKAQAVIGQPLDLYITKGIPYCDAFLFEKNPYVMKSILPALEAESTVFGASVGGSVLKSSLKDPMNKSGGNNINKVNLKHIAVCPLQNAVHPGTAVMLRKSLSNDEEETFSFNNFNDLMKSLDNEDLLEKALSAGSATAIGDMSGGQVLQGQSLEGSIKKQIPNIKIKAVMPFVLESIANGTLKGGYDTFKSRLGKKGLTKSESEKLIRLIASNGHKIVSAIKLK